MEKSFYIFPALLSYEVSGEIGIVFPDIPGCSGQCKSDIDIMSYAQETLALHLELMLEDGEDIPEPSPIQDVKTETNEAVIPVRIFIPVFKEKLYNKAENRTVTLPYWLNRAAKQAGINFSQTLQDALMQKLGVYREVTK